jgi:hypothetical protein
MKRSQRFRIAEALEPRCVLSAAGTADFGGMDGFSSLMPRADREIGPALVASFTRTQIDFHEAGGSIVSRSETTASLLARDAVFGASPVECGVCSGSNTSATVVASMTRSGSDFGRDSLLAPSFDLPLQVSPVSRSLGAPLGVINITPRTITTTIIVMIGPILPQGWSSAAQHVVERPASPSSYVPPVVRSPITSEPNHAPQQNRPRNRVSAGDMISFLAAAVSGQTWAAAYLTDSHNATQTTNFGGPQDTSDDGATAVASTDSDSSRFVNDGSRSLGGTEEGGFVEFAHPTFGESKASRNAGEEATVDVLPEGDGLLPWETEEALLDDLLAADALAEEQPSDAATESAEAGKNDVARMAFSVTEGGLISPEGAMFAESDSVALVATADEPAANVVAAEPIEVRMDAVLRLFQAFEVTTDLMGSDEESPTEFISIPVEETPIDYVVPAQKESESQQTAPAVATLIVGLVSMGATFGRRTRSGDERQTEIGK